MVENIVVVIIANSLLTSSLRIARKLITTIRERLALNGSRSKKKPLHRLLSHCLSVVDTDYRRYKERRADENKKISKIYGYGSSVVSLKPDTYQSFLEEVKESMVNRAVGNRNIRINLKAIIRRAKRDAKRLRQYTEAVYSITDVEYIVGKNLKAYNEMIFFGFAFDDPPEQVVERYKKYADGSWDWDFVGL